MTELTALLYADWRAFVNELRRVGRSRTRLGIWLVYFTVLGLFAYRRAAGAGHGTLGGSAGLVRADLFVCLMVLTLAFSLATGRGAVGIFRSRVEARFIIGSPVRAPLAIAYLQARESVGQGRRMLFSLTYLFFVFAPQRISLAAACGDLALAIAIAVAAAAIVVPRRLATGAARWLCVVAGGALGVLTVLPVIRDGALQLGLTGELASRLVAAIPAWHPGTIVFAPQPGWLAAAAGVAAAGIAILASAGRDAYPELYELSLARIDGPRLARRKRTAGAPATVPRVPERLRVPAGVGAIVWKSIAGYRRCISAPFAAAAGFIVGCGGWLLGRFARADDAALFGTVVALIVVLMFAIGVSSSIRLSLELRRPLFWLSRAGLFERLCALLCAWILPAVAAFEVAALGLVAGGGTIEQTLIVSVALPALALVLTAAGFAAFAFFPHAGDLRGPLASLRLIVSLLLVAPPLALAVFGAAFVGAAVALPAAAVVGAAEAAALIGIAAARLDGRIDRLAD